MRLALIEFYIWLTEPVGVARWLACAGAVALVLNLLSVVFAFFIGACARREYQENRDGDREDN